MAGSKSDFPIRFAKWCASKQLGTGEITEDTVIQFINNPFS